MQIIRDFQGTNCLFNPLTPTSSKWKKKQNKQKFQVSFCEIHRNGYIALARVLPKRFDFNGNTIGFCPKF